MPEPDIYRGRNFRFLQLIIWFGRTKQTACMIASSAHGNGMIPLREAPMHASACRKGDLPSKVGTVWRFYLGGFARAEKYYVQHEQAPTAGP